MPGEAEGDREPVNAFEIDDRLLFKHYFEGEEVFDRLKYYYDNQQYRFEVPPEEFDEVQGFLADHGYALLVVADVEPFVVAVQKYTAHPENVFKSSVIHRDSDGYNCFVATDQVTVERLVREGATRLQDTDLENPFA